MRNWLTFFFVIALLAAGGWLLVRLQLGESLNPFGGWQPQLDSTQALLLAGAVAAFFCLLGGGATALVVLMVWGGRQVAVTQAELARKPAPPAPKPPPSTGPAQFSPTVQRAVIGACLGFFALMTTWLIVKLINPDFGVQREAVAAVPPSAAAPAQSSGGASDLQVAFDALPPGEADRGKTEFETQVCASCHSLESDKTIVGPSLAGVASRAARRKPGYSAELYLYESIVNPNAYVVEGFQSGLMPANFAQSLTPQQQADIIAFLLTQK